ncbi:hypothetical protein WSM22_46840 [Cytophagales bacterium WSM2-2]|nr:hypothetical protein WSM22_46840 [Cytophagales bacterium WSM2-2]
MTTVVDKLFVEHGELIKYLEEKKEISMKVFVEENFKKNILLCIASLFEYRITSILTNFVDRIGNKSIKLNNFVYSGAISRKYHTLFEWETPNANKFFAFFGDEFKVDMKQKVKTSEELDKSIKAFLQLGQQRNLLVHQNFGEQFIEKTADELYKEYKTADNFIKFIEEEINK